MKKFTKKFITLFLASLILLVPFSFGEEVEGYENCSPLIEDDEEQGND